MKRRRQIYTTIQKVVLIALANPKKEVPVNALSKWNIQLDPRSAEQIYQQAIKLARVYCPEWIEKPELIFKTEYRQDTSDVGIALLKLFSILAETIIGQVNRIPEKHLLAFYDFIGINHLPPTPARTPLTFMLSPGSENAIIPARTKVASTEDATVIFETLESLTAVNFTINSAYSLNTWEEAYTDHSKAIHGNGEGFYVFGGAKEQQPLEHIIYLADGLFEFTIPINITINFTFKNYLDTFKNYFQIEVPDQELIGPGSYSPDAFPQVNFNSVVIPLREIDGKIARWIGFKPTLPLPLPVEELPLITGITCNVKANSIPDVVFYNDHPIDIKKGFYPFGETPKRGDAFYIGSNEIFSKAGGAIQLYFDLVGGNASVDERQQPLLLIWEYWDGLNWKMLSVADNTHNFTLTGDLNVSFICPKISATEINSISCLWIRVRIATGGYGRAAAYEQVKSNDEIVDNLSIDDNQKQQLKSYLAKQEFSLGMKYREASFSPPFVHKVNIECSYPKDKKIQYCKTYNNFAFKTFETIDSENPLKPFTTLYTENPAFYLGFEAYPANKPISLYFSLNNNLKEVRPEIIKSAFVGGVAFQEGNVSEIKRLCWEYFDGVNWETFGVEDGTDLFSKSGIVKLIIPSAITQKREFGKELFWIRIILNEDAPQEGSYLYKPPLFLGVYPNTIWAEQAVIIRNELLGSSNGEADQTFSFLSNPVLGQQIIEIKEPSIPTGNELAALTTEDGLNPERISPLRVERNEAGDVQEIWVRWREVTDFVNSKPWSRHYMIDRVEGKVLFGNGAHGMIPPALPNNIMAREYKAGGGRNGNQKRNTLTSLKTTIPNVLGVTNYESSCGGGDLETIDDVLIRAPHVIKTRGRAVTQEDFEWLAREASPQVAKARCLIFEEDAILSGDATSGGGTISINDEIRIIIAPFYEDGNLYPDSSLLDFVGAYLKERAFPQIRDLIQVSGPVYQRIDLEIEIVPVIVSEGPMVAERVERRLQEFLNPITGGYESQGWSFGEALYFSKIAAIIEKVEGVDYILNMIMNNVNLNQTQTTFIKVKEDQLPQSGMVKVGWKEGKRDVS